MDPERCDLGVLVGEIGDDEAAEGAEEGAEEVRVGVAVAGEDVGVLGVGEELEDLVELGGAEEEPRVVHEAEDQHGHAADDDARQRRVQRVDPPAETALLRPEPEHVHLLAAHACTRTHYDRY